MSNAFSELSTSEQTIKLNELLCSCESYFSVGEIFTEILPKEIIVDGHRGDLMITHQDVAYFNIAPGHVINIVHIEYINAGENVFDACIRMLEFLNSTDKNIEMTY